MAKKPLVILDDRLALKLLHREDYRAQFPEIAACGTKKTSCCSGPSKTSQTVNHVKQTVAGFGPARATALRQLLATDRIKVVYRDQVGAVRTVEL